MTKTDTGTIDVLAGPDDPRQGRQDHQVLAHRHRLLGRAEGAVARRPRP
ncbi:MAG: hypothetical protein MZV64_33835 [Ignavibacteriales bacterium]|nr:hypothetical protein [Ignavibacteriales bacterium]